MKYDVLMIIKTIGLEYDDRLKKECNTLVGLQKKVKIIVLDDTNLSKRGFVYNNIEYKSTKSFTRRYLPHKKFLIVKLLEMSFRFLFEILTNRSRVIWVHNFETFQLIPFVALMKKTNFIDKIVWDHHELTASTSLGFIKSKLYRLSVSCSDFIIQANKKRCDLFISEMGINPDKVKVIENFVDDEFQKSPVNELSDNLSKWLKGDQYYLAQGGASNLRNFKSIVEAFLLMKKKLVVIGPIQDKAFETIQRNYSNFNDFIYFTGLIPQNSIIPYIDSCMASIIFYSYQGGINFKYCAPNRIYQAISRGKPIITGDNPTMKEIVTKYNNGVFTGDEGDSPTTIISCIKKIEDDYSFYKKNAIEIIDEFSWSKNEGEIISIVN